MTFKQPEWLKSCISLNIKYRINSKNEFEKNINKILNNSICIKQFKVKDDKNIRLATNEQTRNTVAS